MTEKKGHIFAKDPRGLLKYIPIIQYILCFIVIYLVVIIIRWWLI